MVGYMGCGKSTLARKLSRRLGVRAIDTDAEVERIEGASVSDIFRYEGEERFRELEREVVARLSANDESCIVATGGGLPTWSDNMSMLSAVGTTVYLRRSARNIASRLSPYGRAKRPKLRGLGDEELVDYMARNIAEREPFYSRAALVIDCDTLTDEEVMDRILEHLDPAGSGTRVDSGNSGNSDARVDSGLGGLTVWREVRKLLPEESLLYLGDGKNCPYGSRPRTEVQALADAAVGRLVAEGCKLVVVACNTATAAAIDFLRAKYDTLPIVGMEPAVKPACLHTRSGVVGVLATERSLDGDLFHRTAARYGRDVTVIAEPGRGFVELVENDLEATPEAERTVAAAMEGMLARGADQIVLGCTHYPFLMDAIRRATAGRDVTVIDPSPAVARRTAELLDRGNLRAEPGHRPEYRFLTFSDDAYRDRLRRKAFSCDVA